MAWTQTELEELYCKINKLGAEDPAFRKELNKNPMDAIRKIAGKELPEGFQLKFIENDPTSQATYAVPDFTHGELNMKELQQVSGGNTDDGQNNGSSSGGSSPDDDPPANISFLLIISACAAAIQIAGCGGDACGAAGCPADGYSDDADPRA